jgi:bacterioferritin
MKGHPQIIALLNEVLTGELTAVNQYWLHARLCDNWGYERLWKKIRAESIDEMKHADLLIERILYLDGFPNLQKLDKLNIGQNVVEALKSDLAVEAAAIPRLNEGIELARSLGDNGSRELLERILVSEEKHANWLEEQLTLVQQVGEQNYLAQQIKEDDE